MSEQRVTGLLGEGSGANPFPDRINVVSETPIARELLVTLHYPLDMGLAAAIMLACANVYPTAVVGEDGTIWSAPASKDGPR